MGRGVAVALALVLVASGCGDDAEPSSSASSTTTAATSADEGTTTTATTSAPRPEPEELGEGDPSFYDLPDPIPAGEHGDLLRYQRTGEQPEGLTRYRVMYLSARASGEPTVVTGLVSVPEGPAPDGGWPLVTYARGSSGLADDCGISRAVDGMLTTLGDLAAEASLLEAAAARHGLVAAVTDYQGIGGPGIHPFLHGTTEARAVLDIARAARGLPGVDVGADVGIMGYSQGGHAALWAGQEADRWTPELTVHGTVAGAPASEVPELVAPGAHLDGGSLALLVAGWAQEEADLDVDDVLTEAGRRMIEVFDATCRPDDGALAELAGDELLRRRPEDLDEWREALAASVPGHAGAAAPVLLLHGDADANIDVGDSEVLRQRLCAAGTPTERRVVPGANHIAGAVPTIDDGTAWLAGRIAGTQPPPACP